MVSTGELNEVETYDVDFDHQFLETEKYDAKPTYKKFLGYRPGVYVIGDMIVYVENSDGNTNVRFYQAETHKRFFALLEANSIRVNRFRALILNLERTLFIRHQNGCLTKNCY